MAGYSVTNQWTNSDGLTVSYAPDAWPDMAPKEVIGDPLHTVAMHVNLTDMTGLVTFPRDLDNDGITDGFSLEDFHFEDGDILVEAKVVVGDTAAAGGTALLVGTYGVDGTAIDADGLVTATEATLASLTADTVISGAGAQLGTRLTKDAYIAASPTGTYTAGEVDIIITYMRLPN